MFKKIMPQTAVSPDKDAVDALAAQDLLFTSGDRAAIIAGSETAEIRQVKVNHMRQALEAVKADHRFDGARIAFDGADTKYSPVSESGPIIMQFIRGAGEIPGNGNGPAIKANEFMDAGLYRGDDGAMKMALLPSFQARRQDFKGDDTEKIAQELVDLKMDPVTLVKNVDRRIDLRIRGLQG